MNIEEITVLDENGRRTYVPTIETARKAPAVVCAVASRIVRLRERMAKLKPDVSYSLKDIEDLVLDTVGELPFEKDFLSGKIEKVDDGIIKCSNE